MHYVSQEQIARAREIDILSYLQSCEPYELVSLGKDRYCTRTHDSLKISNGKWYWWSQGIGGVSALDYLIKVKGLPLPKAVEQILGTDIAVEELPFSKEKRQAQRKTTSTDTVTKKSQSLQTTSQSAVSAISTVSQGTEAEINFSRPVPFLLPKPAGNNRRVVGYLLGRKIDLEIIRYCLEHYLLYEEALHHNAVFVGRDTNGKPQYAMMRSTLSQKRFMQEVDGSNKAFSFRIPAENTLNYSAQAVDNNNNSTLHIFESAIDALSFATLLKNNGYDWRRESYLSLGGVAKSKELPIALQQFLQDYPAPAAIHLRLDNDEVGKTAAQAISSILLNDGYLVKNYLPPKGKDYNDYLCLIAGEAVPKEKLREKPKDDKREIMR